MSLLLLSVEYEFEIKNKYKKKRYRVSRTIVRSEMGTKTFKAKLSELKNNNIEEVLSEDVDNVNKKIINIANGIIIYPMEYFHALDLCDGNLYKTFNTAAILLC